MTFIAYLSAFQYSQFCIFFFIYTFIPYHKKKFHEYDLMNGVWIRDWAETKVGVMPDEKDDLRYVALLCHGGNQIWTFHWR